MKPSIKSVLRACLLLLLVASMTGSGLATYHIWRNPTFQWLVAAADEKVTAQLARLSVQTVTQEKLDSVLTQLLGAPKRNWTAIIAVEETASERGLRPSPEVQSRRDEIWATDSSYWAEAKQCAACAWDPKECSLSAILICRAPVDLTPLGDIAGVTRESANYIAGREVDMFELTISVLGLGAIALVAASGGSSASIKLGAAVLKTGRRMGLVSARLSRFVVKTGSRAVDWTRLSKATRLSDLGHIFKPAALRPLGKLATDASAMRHEVGVLKTLHVLHFADTPWEFRALTRAVRAGGKKTVGLIHFVGKSKLIRATLRYGNSAVRLFYWLGSLILSLLLWPLNLLGNILIRRLRRRCA